ncbi:uncharacterized protein LOC129201437 isoform X2 [Grus americana]|uniref:uncharacterized protein LOC129201437 isoform X2 n=1 Tax=Grus americana TaxID=9117 RepID=UPI002407ACF7|nr:uncharacterized protein LOC129201437 isoform X2 [Grus americana]
MAPIRTDGNRRLWFLLLNAKELLCEERSKDGSASSGENQPPASTAPVRAEQRSRRHVSRKPARCAFQVCCSRRATKHVLNFDRSRLLLGIISGICLTSRALLGDSHRPLTDGCEFSPSSQETRRHICGYVYVVRPVHGSDRSPLKFPFLPSSNLPALLPLLYPPCVPPTAYGMCFGTCTRSGTGCGCFYCGNDEHSLLPSPLLLSRMLLVMSLIRTDCLLRPLPVIIAQHPRAINKPFFPC